ncbi:MAG: TlpA family protein disulfide reductase [FCB group bacterium]|nr:TlpA family protein disulfide reductase [FCB group bacterium]
MQRTGRWLLLLIGILINSLVWSQDSAVSIPTEDSDTKTINLDVGDIAPSWAIMKAPGKFEFLRNWTVAKDKPLRKPQTQPNRHVVVMSFFATWCKPCMKELPHLQNVYESFEGQNVKFFLVDITEATRSTKGYEDSPKAKPFLAKKGITMPILNDNRGITKEKYGVETLPRLFIIDKYQTIRLTKHGFHDGEDFEGELTEVIAKLLKEE